MLKTGIIKKARKLIGQTTIGEWIRSSIFQWKLKRVQANHRRELERVRSKEKINVVFILVHKSIWKYEGVYRIMEKDEIFNPVVIICPFTAYGQELMLEEMNQAYDLFVENGYNVIKTYNEGTGEWLDVKKDLNPDIICFTYPWNATKEQFCIENYLDKLTCYVPYGYKCSRLNNAHYNKPMQNFTWKFFIETSIHKKLATKYAQNQAVNAVVTGYPGMDVLVEKKAFNIDPWKIKNKCIKRIIWAPHHSIPGTNSMLSLSTFMDYSNFFFDMADKYRNSIQIAFKPHPVLRKKLSYNDVWGQKRTEEYFEKWKNLENGLLSEGDYINLFATSDGMIHDGASFLIDYLYTDKPAMYLIRENDIENNFNELGKQAFSCHYHAREKEVVEDFIKMIIDEKDSKSTERKEIFEKYVKPPNNTTASKNIYEIIKKECSIE